MKLVEAKQEKGRPCFTYKLKNSNQGVFKLTWVQVNTEQGIAREISWKAEYILPHR